MSVRYTGMNPNGLGTLTDSDHLWQSARDILTTPIGSRVMRRDYGSIVPDLIDAPQNEVTRLQLMSATVIALTRWEPRIALNAVDIVYSASGKVEANLTGLITETMELSSGTITIKGGNSGNG
ncbi:MULTISPECIES: GPW/gp25 family protein [Brenneria]|uniref:Baseplate assembly protein n=1 Tax=Brenneria nigrifluens DSM 30175 = ATCC 13028 TaxID=1121120 RepID=A0A2U1UQF0_9GAMM|nr:MULTISPECIES: GPW/gp25 family protein [Brenneria]EHD23643.1 GPW/gp25 family protein [Brenneria sp. EniD312]PWC23900.1 baseplate assembly protein [Brenneria nigrifluens DSM 30175 = ATCC 13028]QCR06571.1 baseplate assembly protein [Brenneria nigrifluens DSM 30175 = ATCC 13028]